jgi:hypothetical protein
MTQDCIDSAGADNVILVETGIPHKYSGVNHHVIFEETFNYNKALNKGLEIARYDIHVLANNDLIFYEGWTGIGDCIKYYDFDSACAWFTGSKFPQGDFIYKGYEIATHILGWCIFITKEALSKIGKLDESVDFWYSDNVYADQLKAHGLKHGLFCNARVDHICSQTLMTMPMRIKRQYSIGQLPKYNNYERNRKR